MTLCLVVATLILVNILSNTEHICAKVILSVNDIMMHYFSGERSDLIKFFLLKIINYRLTYIYLSIAETCVSFV